MNAYRSLFDPAYSLGHRRSFVLGLLCILCLATNPIVTAQESVRPAYTLNAAPRLQAAERFLAAEMDRWTTGTVVYDEYQSGAAGFYPSLWFGDQDALVVDERSTTQPAVGQTCFRLTYKGSAAGPQDTGIIWVYPDKNEGKLRGRDLSGASRLRGWIRCGKGPLSVQLEIPQIQKPNGDIAVLSQDVVLSEAWQQFELRIPKYTPLDDVRMGFAVVVASSQSIEAPYDVFLDDVWFDNTNTDQLRFIRSYVPKAAPEDDFIRNAAFLYDNCLALLAFLAQNDADGDARARQLADTIVWAQLYDRHFTDGRWRNAYAVGPLLGRDEKMNRDIARLPGVYDSKQKRMIEDRYAVSSDCGNCAWAGLSLVTAHLRFEAGKKENYKYLKSALRAAEWIETNCRFDGAGGGYTGGFEGWEPTDSNPGGPTKLQWRSTEHNIDVYVFFSRLANAIEAAEHENPEYWSEQQPNVWRARANRAAEFVLSMFNQKQNCFRIGVRDAKGTINTDAVASDAQTWALLAMGHLPEFRKRIKWTGPPATPSIINWVERHCRQHICGHSGYAFSDVGTGIWPEGAGHLSCCYSYLRDFDNNRRVLREMTRLDLAKLHDDTQPAAAAGIAAAYPETAETGLVKEFAAGLVDMWKYPARDHVGATAWFVLAAHGANPYWIDSPRVP